MKMEEGFMKIEIWSDIVCPFCYIGKRRLEEALSGFSEREQVEILYKSYELDPNSSVYSGKSIYESLAKKFGMTVEQAKQNTEGVRQHAADTGLVFDFDSMKPTNTFAAHRLIKWAEASGKAEPMIEKLYEAYFTNGQIVSETETLAAVAEQAGMNREEALRVISDPAVFAEEVRADETEARQLGIQGVPFFIFNRKFAVSGAQPKAAFEEALAKAWEAERPVPFEMVQDKAAADTVCNEDGCSVPPRKNNQDN